MASRPSASLMKKRKTEIYETFDKRIYIFCEGTKTEPNYFRSMKEAIEGNPIYKNRVFIQIEGVGKDTIRVIQSAQEYIEGQAIRNADVWCVYDKDSFPSASFNAVSEKATMLSQNEKSVTYYAAWSNQCIEYWFILHFDFYIANNDRKQYMEYLNQQFAGLGLGRYQKNSASMFHLLYEYGNPKQAIQFAKKQLDFFDTKTDADSAPATKVFLLVEELARYLPEMMKSKFI